MASRKSETAWQFIKKRHIYQVIACIIIIYKSRNLAASLLHSSPPQAFFYSTITRLITGPAED